MEANQPNRGADPSEVEVGATQLHLIAPGPWRLPESTRAVGRRGIAQARAALEAARRNAIDHPDLPSSAAA